MKIIKILILVIISVSFFSCKPEEIILHGAIKGKVTNAFTGLPAPAAYVILDHSTDTIFTGSDGIYLIIGLIPGDYVIQAKTEGYDSLQKDVPVASAETTDSVDFPLTPASKIEIHPGSLDFGSETTQLPFTISSVGSGGMRYDLWSSKDWIKVDPRDGSLYGKPDTITVTIDKTGLSESSYHKEFIRISTMDYDGRLKDNFIDIYWNRSNAH